MAYRDGHRSARRALFSDAIEAVSRLSFDVTREDAGDRLVTSRVRFMSLVDGTPNRWKELGPWLAAEQQRGAAIGADVIEAAKTNQPTSLDEHLKMLKPWMDWNMALTSNLRHLQRKGYDATELLKLRKAAEEHAVHIYEKRGWQPPENPLKPLD